MNIIGEYTDLTEGHVLPVAIPQVTRVWAAGRTDGQLGLHSLQEPAAAPVEVPIDGADKPAGWVAYPLAVARSLRAAGHAIGGADILVDSQVPVGAGLSSSAALECSVVLGLCGLHGVHMSEMSMAIAAQRAENEFVGVPCGIMDQAASMCSKAGHALLLDTRQLDIEQVPFDLQGHNLSLVVVNTGVKHDLVGSAYADRRRSCLDAARLLGVRALRDVPAPDVDEALGTLRQKGTPELARCARHVLTEEARVLEVAALLKAGRTLEVGPVMNAGHRSLRDDFAVSCAELDTVVEAAVGAGALGARLTGAGFGGSAIVLCLDRDVPSVTAAVTGAFANQGWAPPEVFEVSPSQGARREL